MNSARIKLLLSLVAFAVPLLGANSAHALYKCVDEKGVTYYGDTMPVQCAKKPVVEMSKQGSIVRKYDAPLTPEQLKAIEEDKVRNKEKNDKIAVQKLRDNALMSTYGAEREFDMARDKDIAGLDSRRKTLSSRTGDVDKNLAKLNNDMEFYQAGKSKTSRVKEAPTQLVQDHKRAVHEAEGLRAEIERIDKGKEEVRARYEGEKSRWKRLKAGMPAGTLLDEEGKITVTPELRSQIVGQSQVIPGRPRGIASCEGKVYECTLGITYYCRGPNVGGPGVNQAAVKCLEDRR
jgi:prefoldin subunit 5